MSFFLFLQSGDGGGGSIHNKKKVRERNKKFTCCKNTFPNFNVTRSSIKTFILVLLGVSATNTQKKGAGERERERAIARKSITERHSLLKDGLCKRALEIYTVIFIQMEEECVAGGCRICCVFEP